jgi:uncharacterized protein YbjT (DUF2867 family)
MTTLITGATGHIGRPLVDDLLYRGIDVRALTRDSAKAALPEPVALVEGSLASAPTEAFTDVDAVFLFPADEGADAFVQRAVDAGVTRFVVLSSLAVSGRHERDAGSASAQHHRAIEHAVTSRTDDWTILRPGNFANNLLFWSFPIRSGQPVRIPYPTSSQVLIHEADVAAAAATALTDPTLVGRILELSGPESSTKLEQLSTIGEAMGLTVPFVEISADEFRADMAPFMPNDIVDMLLRYWAETVDEPEAPLPPVLGLHRRPLATWAHDHRAAFDAL